ncbi:MAG: helix-turn-helix transcriptional regulator [Cumulibacter sp.]
MSLLVPFLLSNPGSTVSDLASEFDTTAAQIKKDLLAVSFCGLPGQGMGDLIEVVYDGDRVSITESAGMDRPLQLTAAEASSLVIALRAMAQSPGSVDHDTVLGALAKLEDAIGARATSPVTVESSAESHAATPLRSALADDRAVRIEYWSAARDELTDRVIDPIQIFRIDGVDYLQAWCRRVDELRTFRLDRIGALEVLDEPRAHHDAPPRDLSEGVYTPSADDLNVELQVSREGRWVIEYYDVGVVQEAADGGARIALRLSSDTLDRLVSQLGQDGLAGLDDPEVRAAAERVAARSAAALARYDDVVLDSATTAPNA